MKNKNSRTYSIVFETIPERLTRLRKQAGLTGKQLAEKVGTQQSRISDIENGKGYLYAEELPVYASALNTTVSYLVTGNQPDNETLSRETGLSDEVINRLRSYHDKGNTLFADSINLLFENSTEPDSPLMTNGETILALFREFVLCPERELIVKTMNATNPAFALTRDEAYQLRLINSLSFFRQQRNKAQKPE